MMLEQLSENLAQIVQSNPWLAPLAAFAGGLLTAANPCVLAMAPLMVGYVAGQEARGVGRSFLLSLTFSSGREGRPSSGGGLRVRFDHRRPHHHRVHAA